MRQNAYSTSSSEPRFHAACTIRLEVSLFFSCGAFFNHRRHRVAEITFTSNSSRTTRVLVGSVRKHWSDRSNEAAS